MVAVHKRLERRTVQAVLHGHLEHRMSQEVLHEHLERRMAQVVLRMRLEADEGCLSQGGERAGHGPKPKE